MLRSPCSLVTTDQREGSMGWPVTNLCVQVGVADTRVDDLHEDFTSTKVDWSLDILNRNVAPLLVDDGGLVALWNLELSLSWVLRHVGYGCMRCEV